MRVRPLVGASLLTSLALAVGCLQPPDYPEAPVLTFVGYSRDSLAQGAILRDSTSVFFEFTDGDGDIVVGESDSLPDLRLINLETGEVLASTLLDPIDRAGVEKGVSGDLRILLFGTCCDYPVSSNLNDCQLTDRPEFIVDTLLVEATMRDRAGNVSEPVRLAPLYLLCDSTLSN